MDTYRAVVDKRDQRAFLPRPLPEPEVAKLLNIPTTLHINRVIAFGHIDPDRAAPPRSVARRRLPLEELVRWETW